MNIEIICAIVSAVVAVVAIIAPIISTILNNKYQVKQQAILFASHQKLELYKEFLDIMNLTLASTQFTMEHAFKFKCIFSKVYLLCDVSTRNILDKMNTLITENDNPNSISQNPQFRLMCNSLMKSLRDDLKSLR